MEIKDMQIKNKEIRLPLFTDDNYKENVKDSTKKLLDLIVKYSKIVEYMVNIQKSTAFLYIVSEPEKFKVKKPLPFTFALPKMKHPVINLTKCPRCI